MFLLFSCETKIKQQQKKPLHVYSPVVFDSRPKERKNITMHYLLLSFMSLNVAQQLI